MQQNTNVEFQKWHHDICQKLNYSLELNLPMEDKKPSLLHQAIAYSVLIGGKRLRPSLIFAVGEELNIEEKHLLRLSEIIEIMHVYSLVHDDLPGMDNDKLRRGKPTCHIKYDEATAILVGDCLQSLSFEWLCQMDLPAKTLLKLCHCLAKTIGPNGMAQGQSLDIQWSQENQLEKRLKDVKQIHRLKTGLLIKSCIKLPLIIAHQNKKKHPLKSFAKHLGIAFQIQDDILDIEGNEEKIGKDIGSDEKNRKLTYPKILGLDQAKKQRDKHYQKCFNNLKKIGWENTNLAHLAQAMIFPRL